MSEHDEQVEYFTALKYLEGKHPELCYIFAVPNGGRRAKFEASRLKDEGVKRGVPDIIVPIPMGEFCGMAIEMKYGENRQSLEQKDYEMALIRFGWCFRVCYSGRSAIRDTAEYLRLPDLLLFAGEL